MLSHYLRELSKVEILPAEKEKQLWKQYKEQGDRNARQELITSYQPLVYKLVARMSVSNELMMDLVQEGIIGLIEAVEKFEPDKNVRFSTYAKYRIRGRVLNYLRRDLKLDLDVISLDNSFEDGLNPLEKMSLENLNLEKEVEERYLKKEILGAMKKLSDKERMALSALLIKKENVNELAEKMQLSPGHLYRLQRKAIKRVRGMLSGLIKELKKA